MEEKENHTQKNNHDKQGGKRRVSLLKYVGWLFAGSIIISMFAMYFVSGGYRFQRAAKESGKAARDACLMAEIILKYEDPQLSLRKYEDKRNEVHALFSSICAFSGLKYLYLYTVDEQEVRHRLVVASADLKDDQYINETAGFGTTSDEPLYKQEREALEGDVEGGFEIITNDYGKVCAWFMPVLDQNDNVVALIGADYSMDHVQKIEKNTMWRSTAVMVIVFIMGFILSIIMVRLMIVKPLGIISDRMKNFMQDRNCSLPPKWMPFEDSIENEVSDIADSFRTMGNDLNEYLSQVEELTRKQVANQIQMDVARNIQYGMVLPEYFHEDDSIRCEGFMHAAREVGGDFYGGFYLEDGKYCGFIGDVSDKGASAALFMAMTRTMLIDHLKMGGSPAEAINRTNDELCEHNPEGMFVTLFAFTMNPATGEIIYANAGHNPPLIIGKEGVRYLEMEAGMVTGLMENIDIKDQKLKLERSETIIIYTDGIVDAVNKAGENFGEARLKELFEKDVGSEEAAGAVDRIKTAVGHYSEGCTQFDDMTVLVVTVKN